MPDDPTRVHLTLEEVEAAAQPIRFALLGHRGWFTGSDAAADLPVERGTVRQHARVLVRIGLAEERPIPGAARDMSEWHVTDRGAEVRRRVARLIGKPYERRLQGLPVAALLAVESAESGQALTDVLMSLVHGRLEVVPGYRVQVASPGPAAVAHQRRK